MAERFNRTIQDISRCSLRQSNLPSSYWSFAVCMASYVHNRRPSSSKALNGISPYEALFKVLPKIEYIKPFGSFCFNHKMESNGKWSDKRIHSFVPWTYSEYKNLYRLRIDKHDYIRVRHVKFPMEPKYAKHTDRIVFYQKPTKIFHIQHRFETNTFQP